MATAILNSSVTELGGKFVLDTNCTASQGSTNNVTSAAGSVFLVEIDNEANASAVYLKMRDATSAVASNVNVNADGTPHFTFKCPAYKKITYSIPGGAVFSSGISMWCTTSPDVGSVSDASSAVIVKIIAS